MQKLTTSQAVAMMFTIEQMAQASAVTGRNTSVVSHIAWSSLNNLGRWPSPFKLPQGVGEREAALLSSRGDEEAQQVKALPEALFGLRYDLMEQPDFLAVKATELNALVSGLDRNTRLVNNESMRSLRSKADDFLAGAERSERRSLSHLISLVQGGTISEAALRPAFTALYKDRLRVEQRHLNIKAIQQLEEERSV